MVTGFEQAVMQAVDAVVQQAGGYAQVDTAIRLMGLQAVGGDKALAPEQGQQVAGFHGWLDRHTRP
ncbi:hypothetical protein D3C72_2386730 [compost metagenome]